MRKKRKNSNNFSIYSLVMIFVVGTFFIIINDSGILKLIEVKREHTRLSKEISTLQAHQIKLNNEIHELKTNAGFIEKIAREKFMMAKPGEKVFKVMDSKKVN